jgi:hypothetical protein
MVLALELGVAITTGVPTVPTALSVCGAIEVLKPPTVNSPVRVKTSPLIVVTERWLIGPTANATIAPVNPAKATTINIRYAGTCFRERLIFSKPRSFPLFDIQFRCI